MYKAEQLELTLASLCIQIRCTLVIANGDDDSSVSQDLQPLLQAELIVPPNYSRKSDEDCQKHGSARRDHDTSFLLY